MIAKTYQPQPAANALQQAGERAEKQMAFYLKRAFRHREDVLVFHGLRLPFEGEVAQIDHLLLHGGGLILVESKSVTSSVRINGRGEWARLWDGEWKGMPSPILQGRRQADLLRRLLNHHAKDLRQGAFMGLVRTNFDALAFDVLVAISDQGLLECAADQPEVGKADQVPERVESLLAGPKGLPAAISGRRLSAQEMEKLSKFLLECHQPNRAKSKTAKQADSPKSVPPHPSRHKQRQPAQPPSKASAASQSKAQPTNGVPKAQGKPARSSKREKVTAPTKSPTTPPQCNKCGSGNLSIQYRYTYYYKCSDCGGNSKIKLQCPKCSEDMNIKKRKLEFFAVCKNGACGYKVLHLTNPPETASA